jgi:ribonuclease VapC
MVVDSSVLVAIAMRETLAEPLFRLLVQTPAVSVGAPSLLESSMVLSGRLSPGGDDATGTLALLVATLEIDVIPFRADHWPVAWSAFLRFGKGRHPAALNFGDCMTYATARLAGEPLLCVGNDFAQTDLELVPLPAQP